MRILFVAMPFSIHTARWINQLNGLGWEIHLYPSLPCQPVHQLLNDIVYHSNKYAIPNLKDRLTLRVASPSFFGNFWSTNKLLNRLIARVHRLLRPGATAQTELQHVINRVHPDIIHSLETQHAGYLVSGCSRNSSAWIHSCWGIDLHFFGKLSDHQTLIRKVLSSIDVFVAEGERDKSLSREFGYSGVVEIFPSVGGGFTLPPMPTSPPSKRKKILVKGTQDVVRRGLVALRAVERCQDVLQAYEIILYSANDVTQTAAELIRYRTGLKITILEHLSHSEMLNINGQARLSLCINMSDGVPNSMLEAMMMGAFPIQSDTAIVDEWLKPGETGCLVPAEDPEVIESAIRLALQNDDLVDTAAVANRKRIATHLDFEQMRTKAISMYDRLLSKNSSQ